MIQLAAKAAVQPAIVRLSTLAPLDAVALEALDGALAMARTVAPRHEIQTEGEPVPLRHIIVSGWAARVRVYRDGQRQFLSFLLPGDVVGLCDQPKPLAISTIVALTPVELCPAPSTDEAPALIPAYDTSRALHEAYLLEHIMRLGRMGAHERIVSLLLELHERLTLNGMADGTQFDVPLTQEMLGDALGLTPVHINRMLQQARRAGDLLWHAGRVTLSDPAALADWIGRNPTLVCG